MPWRYPACKEGGQPQPDLCRGVRSLPANPAPLLLTVFREHMNVQRTSEKSRNPSLKNNTCTRQDTEQPVLRRPDSQGSCASAPAVIPARGNLAFLLHQLHLLATLPLPLPGTQLGSTASPGLASRRSIPTLSAAPPKELMAGPWRQPWGHHRLGLKVRPEGQRGSARPGSDRGASRSRADEGHSPLWRMGNVSHKAPPGLRSLLPSEKVETEPREELL